MHKYRDGKEGQVHSGGQTLIGYRLTLHQMNNKLPTTREVQGPSDHELRWRRGSS
jgi:hypothetical protein